MRRPLLLPLTSLYRLALAARELRLGGVLEPVRRLRFPAISVGSLSAGGAGKTPLTIALAKALRSRGVGVDVLSRGYGRSSDAAARVDVSGPAEDFGDEPLLIAREAGVPVFVAGRRYEAGLLAEAALQGAEGPVVHLLDDGFQHRQLHRELDIVLLDDRDLRDHLLPAGNLREPLSAIQRAHVIAIPADGRDTEMELRKLNWQGTVWGVHRRMEVPCITGPVVAFCGIARPQQFFAGLEAGGLKLAERIAFPDHHRYSQRDFERLRDAARLANASLLTTEKDRERMGTLGGSLPLQTARLRIEIQDEEDAMRQVVERVRF